MQYLSPFDGFKKTLIFTRREEELRHAIKNNYDPKKVRRAAERVRTAKLQFLKARCHYLKPCTGDLSDIDSSDLQAEYWKQRSVDDIIDEYLKKNATDLSN